MLCLSWVGVTMRNTSGLPPYLADALRRSPVNVRCSCGASANISVGCFYAMQQFLQQHRLRNRGHALVTVLPLVGTGVN